RPSSGSPAPRARLPTAPPCAWMRTMVTFTSSLDALGAWRAQRLPLVRYAPLALLIAWAGCGNAIASVRGLLGFVLASGFIAQYRLWDDLVDRVRDRSVHPERVLARVAAASP